MADTDPPPPPPPSTSQHHTTIPKAWSQAEFERLKPTITQYHTYQVGPGQCSSLLAQRINAPLGTVWPIVRRFENPQTYKHFIKSCSVKPGDDPSAIGCLREVNVISGLPAATSTECLNVLDDEQHVTGFSIIGGEHRLRNYRSVTTVDEFRSDDDGKIWTVALESYVVDVPEGNTEDDTRMFADTVVRLNLQKLASLTEAMERDDQRRDTQRY
ncbi:hypothetical protein Sjap_004422 [Stephania japonica]|uniref:Abscisic acid receptor PYR1 n=1 Tax=Stephania japonica TaxID=461633 RepID=A0AAP0PJ26_9MAGN